MNKIQTAGENLEDKKWRSLDSLQRRVLGVLVEKAKTTPDSYPLTVNSIKSACNQKSNRNPQMDLDADDVMATLDELREMGAVSEVQGDGRVSKYRHRAYDWLGVNKVELAVVAELLLRGDQTVGELRGRAARMESISGVAELGPIMASLKEKGLLVELSAAGRGQIVTHGLFLAGEQPPARSSSVSARTSAAVSLETAGPSVEASSMLQRIEALEQRIVKLEQRL